VPFHEFPDLALLPSPSPKQIVAISLHPMGQHTDAPAQGRKERPHKVGGQIIEVPQGWDDDAIGRKVHIELLEDLDLLLGLEKTLLLYKMLLGFHGPVPL